jgi:predicted transcriptional regulator
MQKPIVARDIMVKKLITLNPEMDIFEAIDLLLKHRISGAPVVDEDNMLIGIFSEKNCMSVLLEGAYSQLPSTAVFAFMSTNICTVSEETDLLTIAQTFRSQPYRRLPVLRDGKLIGQISRRDILKSVNEFTRNKKGQDSALLYLSSLVDVTETRLYN